VAVMGEGGFMGVNGAPLNPRSTSQNLTVSYR
jgi:hypothetical protein